MRTNIVLDDEKIARIQQITGLKTKKAVVDAALSAFLAKCEMDPKDLIDALSTYEIRDDFDLLTERSLRDFSG